MSTDSPQRSSVSFKWWLCLLLLSASVLNYMDRQALSQTGVRIKKQFHLDNQEYGLLEGAFNAAFAVGALGIGALVDRGNVRLIYPLIVVGWSLSGFAAGFAQSFMFLLVCRFSLGLFEAGNWPCGITTVRRVLKPEERTLGNGMFHSGTALGAIVMPHVVNACLDIAKVMGAEDTAFAWQLPFRLVGAAGLFWALAWLLTVRTHHVQDVEKQTTTGGSYWDVWRDRRFWVLIVVVVGINITWRSFGFWLPTFLREAKGYEERTANHLSSVFFISADLGSMFIGFVTLFLVRRGMTVHKARLWCFAGCSVLTMLTLAAAFLPKGGLLIASLMVIGFGALGLFPLYFAFSQEISAKHQGKVTGTLGCINALVLAVLFPLQGKLVDLTGSFTPALGIAGFAPLVALLVLVFCWGRMKDSQPRDEDRNKAT
jgi:ACS family hexuronate transporter-like MFS transporter